MNARAVLGSVAAAAAVVAVALAVRGAPAVLSRVDAFRVDEVLVEGGRYVDAAELRAAAQLPDSASVWHDLEPWRRRVEAHPMILEARVRRRLPSTLVFEVREREPVALAPVPTLAPVDRDGRLLPLDPSRVRLDLPVIRLALAAGSEASDSVASLLRPAARAVERLRVEPDFFAGLSEVEVDARGWLVARWGSAPQVVFNLSLPVEPRRLRQGLTVLADALEKDPEHTPREVDLIWADQIVVRN